MSGFRIAIDDIVEALSDPTEESLEKALRTIQQVLSTHENLGARERFLLEAQIAIGDLLDSIRTDPSAN